jgi:cytochrome c oxidase assembly protein subunit 15
VPVDRDGASAYAFLAATKQVFRPMSSPSSLNVTAVPLRTRPTGAAGQGPDRLAPVRAWLWIVAVLILLMVVVGGATRLTESGLSITEWKPISGVIPPLSQQAWQAEFDKYKQIPQYAKVFPDMDLQGFKAIFFWEWSHRLLGRIIGFAVAVPLAWFWLRGVLTRGLKLRLLGLLALGGLQGLIGWWMVKSGLAGRTEVSQYRLALHLLVASLTLALAVWIAESLAPARPARLGRATRRLRMSASLLVGGVFIQLGLGALVAGLRGGRIYNTWPLMGDSFVPPSVELWFKTPAWRNLFENAVTAQFDHRIMAYLLLVATGLHAIDCRRSAPGTPTARTGVLLFFVVAAQASIGIATLLWSVPLFAALAHQAFAMAVLATAVTHRCGMRAVAGPSAEATILPMVRKPRTAKA